MRPVGRRDRRASAGGRTGAEWQITPAAELTLTYLTTDRTNTTANGLAGSESYGQFQGDVLRAQFQINY